MKKLKFIVFASLIFSINTNVNAFKIRNHSSFMVTLIFNQQVNHIPPMQLRTFDLRGRFELENAQLIINQEVFNLSTPHQPIQDFTILEIMLQNRDNPNTITIFYICDNSSLIPGNDLILSNLNNRIIPIR